MKSTKKIRFQKTKKQTIKKRSNRNKKVKRRRTRKRNKIYGGMNSGANNNTASYDFTDLDDNDKGNNLLHLAVINNNADEVKKIIDIINSKQGYTVHLDDSDDIINIQNSDGNTPLHLAIQTNNNEIIASLLSNNADINRQNNDGNTPLQLALKQNYNGEKWITPNKEIAKFIITKGEKYSLDINSQNGDGDTALNVAIKNYPNKESQTERKQHAHIITLILKKSMLDLNVTNNNGDTSLHVAIKCYDKEYGKSLEPNDIFYIKLIEYILKRNKFEFKKNNEGNSPLHLLVDMLQKELTTDVTSKKNLEIYNIIKNSVLKYLINKNNKNDILRMKNKAQKTAYQILQTAPDIVNGSGLPSNYKELIKINPDADVMTPSRAITKVVRQQIPGYTGQSPTGQTFQLRTKKQTRQPFR